MKEIQPAFISSVKTLQNVWNDQVDGFPAPSDVEKGHISSSGEFVWIYRGSHLIVTQIESPCGKNSKCRLLRGESGERLKGSCDTSCKYTLSRVDFGDIFQDSSLKIQTVIEVEDHLSFCDTNHNPHLLLVVLNREVSGCSSIQSGLMGSPKTYTPPVASNGRSIIVLYDARVGKVLKSVECQFKVTAVEVISVSECGRKESIVSILPPELQYFHGVIALGSLSGLVVFMDLCLDQIIPESTCTASQSTNSSFSGQSGGAINSSFSGQSVSSFSGQSVGSSSGVSLSKLTYAARMNSSNPSYDVHSKRMAALRNGQHIGLPLNADCITKCNFSYRSCETDNPIESIHDSSSVYVNCLKYLPATNSICIAYNFGGFHIYNLSNYYSLDVSCTLNTGDADALLPVVAFSPLEPENDPKNLSYLWLIRGSDACADNGFGYASAHLYCFGYRNKEWIPDYGHLYSGHESSNVLIDFLMTDDPFSEDANETLDSTQANIVGSSTFISCQTIELGNKWAIKSADGDDVLIDKSLFLFSWEVTPGDGKTPNRTLFALFDLNQYYNAQLPRKWFLKGTNDSNAPSLCPYLAIYSLDAIKGSLPNEDILDLKLHPGSFTKYRSTMYLHDLYFYPASASFHIKTLSERSILSASYFGLQKSALASIRSTGPETLIDPKEWLKSCVNAGLVPDESILTLPLSKQRETLLNVMLHNDELSYLAGVMRAWSIGSDGHLGLDAKTGLDWIMNQVGVIKGCIDKISEPLFLDSDAHFDDEYATKTLYPYEVDLSNLSYLLNTLRDSLMAPQNEKSANNSKEAPKDSEAPKLASPHPLLSTIDQRLDVISCISSYLRVMLWCVDCNMLPEIDEASKLASSESEICYPRSHLMNAYNLRRKKLKRLHPTLKGTEVLIIDGLIDANKETIGRHLKNHSGTSLFPPSSIQVLIGVYLIPGVPLEYKHMIMQYFILEMAALLDAEKNPETLEKIKLFPSSFGLALPLSKFIQGVWGLDQEAFDFSYTNLADPSVVRKYFTISDANLVSDQKSASGQKLASEFEKKFKENLYKRIIVSFVLGRQKSLAIKLASISRNLPSFQSVVDEYKLQAFVDGASDQVRISYPKGHRMETDDGNDYTPPRTRSSPSKIVTSDQGDVILDPALAPDGKSADSSSQDVEMRESVQIVTVTAPPVPSLINPPKSCMKTPKKSARIPTDDADIEMETCALSDRKRVQILEDSERRNKTPSPMKLPESVASVDDASDNMSTYSEDSKVSDAKEGEKKTPTRRSKRQAKKKEQAETPTFGMRLRDKKTNE